MIIRAQELSFRYDSVPVLREASFSVRGGELLAVLGPNGSGKTTLLKCLNRILSPRSGAVFIDGKDTRQMSRAAIAKRIGWVPQQGERSRVKVYDLVLLGRRPHFGWAPGKADHAGAMEALRLLDLEPLAMRYADELSGGEFQLAQIARALAGEPRAVLFDEPTSSLDIGNQHRLMRRIQSLIRGSDRAAVMTMHDINLALRYADSFIMLKEGRIHAAGGREVITPETIREVYNMEAEILEAGGFPLMVPV